MRHSGTENREKGNAIMKLKQKYSHTHTHTQRESTTVALGHSQLLLSQSQSHRIDSICAVWFGFANINHLSVEINN